MKNEQIKSLDFGSWPLPDEYLIEIGRIVTLWTTTESILSLFLTKLAGIEIHDPKGIILFENLTIPQKMDTLGCLVEQLVENHPNLKEYSETLSKLKTAQKGRNKIVHSIIYFDPKTEKVNLNTATTRGKLKTKSESISQVDLKRIVVDIAEANKALYKMVLKKDIPLPWERDFSRKFN